MTRTPSRDPKDAPPDDRGPAAGLGRAGQDSVIATSEEGGRTAPGPDRGGGGERDGGAQPLARGDRGGGAEREGAGERDGGAEFLAGGERDGGGEPLAGAGPASGGAEPASGASSSAGPRRTRTPWRAAFFALAGLGIIAGVAWALLGSRLVVVRSISVTGTHLVTRTQVLAAANVPLGTPLMRVNTAQVAQRIEAIRQVAAATVTKDWPDHLAITVRERVPFVAVRMAAGGYDLVDPSGVIVRWSAARPAALPLFVTSLPGSALRGDSGLAQTSAVLAELPPWLFKSVAQVAVAGASPGAGADAQVTLYLRDHKTVVWGGPGNAAEKDRELAILMRAPDTYFDVSGPGTAVTR